MNERLRSLAFRTEILEGGTDGSFFREVDSETRGVTKAEEMAHPSPNQRFPFQGAQVPDGNFPSRDGWTLLPLCWSLFSRCELDVRGCRSCRRTTRSWASVPSQAARNCCTTTTNAFTRTSSSKAFPSTSASSPLYPSDLLLHSHRNLSRLTPFSPIWDKDNILLVQF